MPTSHADKATRFLALHKTGSPLLMPNAWDAGSARLLVSLGFPALATTSSGFAATLGRLDGWVTRDEALAHAASLVEATDAPVSADLENGYAPDPEGVADTVAGALEAGLAGCSIEDYAGRADDTIYDRGLAVERVAAAAEIAHAGPVHLVLTARAENLIHGRDDLDDTIARRTSGGWCRRSTGRSASSPCPARRRWPSWGRPGSPASRSAGRSPSPRSARWSRPAAS